MKLQIKAAGEKVKVVELSLIKGAASIFLVANEGEMVKNLLEFRENGTVSRCSHANIGDFSFDSRGCLEIEGV